MKISGGERQRLALARALLRKPGILLLDEAPSGLDVYHEEIIYHTLKKLKGRMTIILIAHRFNTIRAADHIIVLEAGKIVECGDLLSLTKNKKSHFSDVFSLN
ncbi:MAG: ATP-binding cassette domain-containing protein [Coxiellaceae bacterium]|nr:ATP-binding cassette domain-containing protein [Coxiellaceae bacterium]